MLSQTCGLLGWWSECANKKPTLLMTGENHEKFWISVVLLRIEFQDNWGLTGVSWFVDRRDFAFLQGWLSLLILRDAVLRRTSLAHLLSFEYFSMNLNFDYCNWQWELIMLNTRGCIVYTHHFLSISFMEKLLKCMFYF
jgi:hypothetical protein